MSQFPDIDGFWDFDDLPSTEVKIKDLVESETASGVSRSVELITQLARVQGLQRKISEARATLLLAKDPITKHAGDTNARAEIRFSIEQGRLFGLSMTPAQSLAYFEKAWNEATKANEVFFSIEAAVMLSISRPPKHQNEWLQKALHLAESTVDINAKLWLPQLYVMNGWHSFDFRKFDEALDNFQKALDQPQSIQSPIKRFAVRWSFARTLRALNRFQEALDIQRELKAEMQTVGKVNGHVFLEMAECFQLLQNLDEAKVHFEQAYKELSLNGWYSDNKSSELSRIQRLSKKN